MTLKQRALRVLTRDELLAFAKQFDIEVTARTPVDELVRRLSASKRATLDKIVPALSMARLREMCNALDLPPNDGKKQELIDAVLGAAGRNGNGNAEPQARENASSYRHKEETLARPDVGTQPQFKQRRPAKTYRYDSSLSPSLEWDDAPAAPAGRATHRAHPEGGFVGAGQGGGIRAEADLEAVSRLERQG